MSDANDSTPPRATMPMQIVQPLGRRRAVLLAIWAAASFGTCYFARDLGSGVAGQTLAYGLAGQGILIVFIVLVLVNAVLFNRDAETEETVDDGAWHGG